MHSYSLEVDTPKKRDKFKKDVTTNGSRKDEFHAKLVAFIQRVNAEPKGGSTARPSLQRRRKHDAVEVDATESSGRRYTTRRACFWPMNVYKKYFKGKRPSRRKVCKFKGTKGVLLDSLAYKDGVIPDDVTQIFDDDMKSITKRKVLHRDDPDATTDEDREGLGEEIFQRGQEMFALQRTSSIFGGVKERRLKKSISGSPNKKRGVSSVKLSCKGERKDPDHDGVNIFKNIATSSIDEGLFCWGGSESDGSGDDADEHADGDDLTTMEPQQQKRARPHTPKATPLKKLKVPAAIHWNRCAERAVFDANEQLDLFLEPSLNSVTKKAFQLVLGKCSELKAQSLESEIKDDEEFDETTSLSLHECQFYLESLTGFMALWEPGDAVEPVTGQELLSVARAVQVRGTNALPLDTVRTRALTYDMAACLRSSDYEKASLLITDIPLDDSSGGDANGFFGCMGIESNAHRMCAQTILLKHIFTAIDVAAKESHKTAAEYADVLFKSCRVCHLAEPLRKEFEHIATIFKANGIYIAKELQTAIAEVRSKDASLCVVFFKTDFGKHVLGDAAARVAILVAYDQASNELVQVQAPPPIDPSTLSENFWHASKGASAWPVAKWKTYRSSINRILAPVDDKFQATYHELMDSKRQPQMDAFNTLFDLSAIRAVAFISPLVAQCERGVQQILHPTEENAPDTLESTSVAAKAPSDVRAITTFVFFF